MATNTALIKKDELDKVIFENLTKYEVALQDLEKVIPYVKEEKLRKKLITTYDKTKELVEAFKAGFVPVDGGMFFEIPDKKPTGKKNPGTDTNKRYYDFTALEAVATMPDDVKELLAKIKKLNIFKKFGITHKKAGDPVLAGRAGDKWFLIAAWINIIGGKAVGFKMKYNEPVKIIA